MSNLSAQEHYAEAEGYVNRAEHLDVDNENIEIHTLLAFADIHLRLAIAHDSIVSDEEEDIRP